MNSKLELRIEAARIAANVEGVNPENLIEVCKKIEEFLNGNAELKEVYDPNENMKMFASFFSEKLKSENEQENYKDYNETAFKKSDE